MAQVNMPKSSIGQQPAAEPQKKFQKVVKGKVTLKEQNNIQKIARAARRIVRRQELHRRHRRRSPLQGRQPAGESEPGRRTQLAEPGL